MSYDPWRTPPRDFGRWAQATPVQQNWPAYADGADGADAAYGDATSGHDWSGYHDTAGYPAGNGYGDPAGGYGWGGYGAGDGLVDGDTAGVARGWPAAREPVRAGRIAGALTGLLAAAAAIGVATLAAAFVRPQASPVIAVGGAFIDRTPPALKNFAVEHFGENDKTVLLLGMYVTIALIAMAIGCLARRAAAIGVAGVAAFGMFGAVVALTRPESRATDVIPSVIGGIAGVAAFLWLARAAAPAAPAGRARRGHRRAR